MTKNEQKKRQLTNNVIKNSIEFFEKGSVNTIINSFKNFVLLISCALLNANNVICELSIKW